MDGSTERRRWEEVGLWPVLVRLRPLPLLSGEAEEGDIGLRIMIVDCRRPSVGNSRVVLGKASTSPIARLDRPKEPSTKPVLIREATRRAAEEVRSGEEADDPSTARKRTGGLGLLEERDRPLSSTSVAAAGDLDLLAKRVRTGGDLECVEEGVRSRNCLFSRERPLGGVGDR